MTKTKASHQRLRRRVLELEEQLVRDAETERAELRLEELLGYRATLGNDAIPAQIIGRDPLPWSGSVTIFFSFGR